MATNFTLIAHRGASEDAPENTLEAFDLALRQGFPHIEADCQLSSDGGVVIIHDESLERLTAGAVQGMYQGPSTHRPYHKSIPGLHANYLAFIVDVLKSCFIIESSSCPVGSKRLLQAAGVSANILVCWSSPQTLWNCAL
jgi:glycerophosphoryl diester phosphodiesterase